MNHYLWPILLLAASIALIVYAKMSDKPEMVGSLFFFFGGAAVACFALGWLFGLWLG